MLEHLYHPVWLSVHSWEGLQLGLYYSSKSSSSLLLWTPQ